MIRITRLFAIFVMALVVLSTKAIAGTIFTLPDNNQVFDVGNFGGNSYAGGRVNATGVNPLLYNLTTSSQVGITVPQYNGRTAISATVTSIDSSTGSAWVSINYGAGLARSGSVSVAGGTVALNQYASTTTSSNSFVTAAAGGNAFGNGAGNNAATAQPGGFWTALTAFGGSIYDAIFSNGKTVAVGGVGNIEGGANAVVFTNLTLTLEHNCGTSFCSLQSVSSDGLWGGLSFNTQVGLLNFATDTQYLLPGDAQVRGVLGGANPVLFYQSTTGPRAWTPLGGADQDFASWYLAVNGTALGFTPTDVGDARVLSGMVLQNVNGSVHVANYSDPSGRGSGAVPEPSTYLLMAAGLVFMWWLRPKQSQTHRA